MYLFCYGIFSNCNISLKLFWLAAAFTVYIINNLCINPAFFQFFQAPVNQYRQQRLGVQLPQPPWNLKPQNQLHLNTPRPLIVSLDFFFKYSKALHSTPVLRYVPKVIVKGQGNSYFVIAFKLQRNIHSITSCANIKER